MKKRDVLVLLSFLLMHINTIWAGDEILLKSRRFTPAKGVSDTAKAKIEAIPQRAHVIIQLEKIPTIKERKELEAKGIKLLSYIPNKAWFASIPSDKSSQVAALSNVRAISEILPEDKIASKIRESGVNDYSTNEKGEAKLAIIFFDDVSLNKASDIISTYNGTVIETATTINALVVYLPKNLIDELAKHDAVHWIDQHYEPIIANDGSREAIHVEEIQALPYNLTGTGVVTGEWDGGWIDTTHHDLAGRVTIGDSGSSTGYHATHVAGTMLGNGCRSFLYGGTDLQWRGMATVVERLKDT